MKRLVFALFLVVSFGLLSPRADAELIWSYAGSLLVSESDFNGNKLAAASGDFTPPIEQVDSPGNLNAPIDMNVAFGFGFSEPPGGIGFLGGNGTLSLFSNDIDLIYSYGSPIGPSEFSPVASINCTGPAALCEGYTGFIPGTAFLEFVGLSNILINGVNSTPITEINMIGTKETEPPASAPELPANSLLILAIISLAFLKIRQIT